MKSVIAGWLTFLFCLTLPALKSGAGYSQGREIGNTVGGVVGMGIGPESGRAFGSGLGEWLGTVLEIGFGFMNSGLHFMVSGFVVSAAALHSAFTEMAVPPEETALFVWAVLSSLTNIVLILAPVGLLVKGRRLRSFLMYASLAGAAVIALLPWGLQPNGIRYGTLYSGYGLWFLAPLMVAGGYRHLLDSREAG